MTIPDDFGKGASNTYLFKQFRYSSIYKEGFKRLLRIHGLVYVFMLIGGNNASRRPAVRTRHLHNSWAQEDAGEIIHPSDRQASPLCSPAGS